MYYKVFVLLRLPVSAPCLCGFGLLNVWQELGIGFFVFAVVVGLLVFLAVTTRRLALRRRGAFRLAWRLLLLEFVGAVLFVGSHDMAAGRNKRQGLLRPQPQSTLDASTVTRRGRSSGRACPRPEARDRPRRATGCGASTGGSSSWRCSACGAALAA